MNAICAHRVTPGAMTAALVAMHGAVGTDFVFAEDSARLESYDDAFPINDPGRVAPAAAAAPDGIPQSLAILKIASQDRTPLWTFSIGRNFAYAGAAPRERGSIIVDLSQMNRILEVDERSAYCAVEPGVTYFQPHEHLGQRGIKPLLSPPEPGWPYEATLTYSRVLNWVPNAGHVDFSLVSPSTGENATRLNKLLRDTAQAADLDYVGAFIIVWRGMHNVLLMIYDKTAPDERAKFRVLARGTEIDGRLASL